MSLESINKHEIYNFLAGRVLEHINFNDCDGNINLIIDRSKSQKEIAIFNEYIQNNLDALLKPTTQLTIHHYLSHQRTGLQAVDLFSWGIYRKYELKDDGWYTLFKHRILSESIFRQ